VNYDINGFIYRTEDIKDEELGDIYVESELDKQNVKGLMSQEPVLLVGSRGTGKTMLLRITEKKLDDSFKENKVLAVMVSFNKAMFLESLDDRNYFRQWMLSKILFALKRKVVRLCNVVNDLGIFQSYFNIQLPDDDITKRLEKFNALLENSWTSRKVDLAHEIEKLFGKSVHYLGILNEMDYFKALIEDICRTLSIKKIILLFDEACHNFIPFQQREFFTLFRDLRSPYISCKAAVYPGITSYGSTFQKFHDARVVRIERDLTDLDYIALMRDIVKNQVDEHVYKIFEANGENFNTLIYASSGNPRLLLKSLYMASNGLKSLNLQNVNNTIKSFFRTDIWNDHTKLGEIYKGHKPFIDWGREFLENKVLIETSNKNMSRNDKGVKQQTIFFAIHRDAPEAVKTSIRILEYSGIVQLHTEGTKVGGKIFDRYQINLGVVLADEQTPSARCKEIITGLSVKLYSEYGMNSPSYEKIDELIVSEDITNFSEILQDIMKQPVDNLDITIFQRDTIKQAGFMTIEDILSGTEEDLQRAFGIGKTKSRRIFNIAFNATIEYISG
jgi:SpoVK/Ycf46/Vps4 family AAA+-type ATPase